MANTDGKGVTKPILTSEEQDRIRRQKKAARRKAASGIGNAGNGFMAGLQQDRREAAEAQRLESAQVKHEQLIAALQDKLLKIDVASSLLTCTAMATLLIDTFGTVFATAKRDDYAGSSRNHHASIAAETAAYDAFGDMVFKHGKFVQHILRQCRIAAREAGAEVYGDKKSPQLVNA